MTISLAPARAAASRINGARSRGPRTPEGKARAAQNALKHGLRAERFVTVGDEDPAAFEALESALIEELAPDGALQRLLASRIARAAWRLERTERIEAALFAHDLDGDLGMALIRDGNGPRAFDTLLRYRGMASAELWRALRMLKALQNEQSIRVPRRESPIEPETRAMAGLAPRSAGPGAVPTLAKAAGPAGHAPGCRKNAPAEMPSEPKVRTDPDDSNRPHVTPAGATAWPRSAMLPPWW
jgi:hypothetical protein